MPAPVEVLKVFPDGPGADPTSPVTVVFKAPVATDANPLRFEPDVAGTHQWLGPRVLRFAPQNPLPYATPMTAWLDASLADATGTHSLEQEYVWTFSTQRPRVLGIKPAHNTSQAATDTPIIVRLSQPVDLSSLKERMALTANRKPVTFDLAPAQDETDGEYRVRVVLKRPLPTDARIEVTVQAGVRSQQGLLPSQYTFRGGYNTYGPLRRLSVTCTGAPRCDLNSPLVVSLSTAPTKDFARHIQVTPEISGQTHRMELRGSSIRIHGPWVPGERYKVSLSADLTDVFGQRLGRGWTGSFKMDDAAAALAPLPPHTTLLATEQHLDVALIGASKLTAQIAPLSLGKLAEAWALANDPAQPWLAGLNTDRETWTLRSPRNSPATRPITVPPGVNLIRVNALDERGAPVGTAATISQRTRIGLQSWSGAAGTLIRVYKSDGSPIDAMPVALMHRDGTVLWTDKSDPQGWAKVPASTAAKASFLIAGTEHDYLFQPLTAPAPTPAPETAWPLLTAPTDDASATPSTSLQTGTLTARPLRKHLLPGQPLEIALEGIAHSGLVLANATVQWSLSATSTPFKPPVTPKHAFGPPSTEPHAEHLQGELMLDVQGRATLSIALPPGWDLSTRHLQFEADTGSDGMPWSRATAEVWRHPSPNLLGIWLESSLAKVGAEISPAFTLVRPTGAQARPVPIEATLERQNDTPTGRTWTRIDTCSLATPEAPCRLKGTVSGPHRIRAVTQETPFHETTAPIWLHGNPQDADRVAMALDQTRHQPGQQARLLLRGPLQGSHAALIMASPSRLEHRDLGRIGPETVLTIPVEPWMREGVRLSAVMHSTATDGSPQVHTAQRHLAVIPAALNLDTNLAQRPSKGAFKGSVRLMGSDGSPMAKTRIEAFAIYTKGTPDLKHLTQQPAPTTPALSQTDTFTAQGRSAPQVRLESATAPSVYGPSPAPTAYEDPEWVTGLPDPTSRVLEIRPLPTIKTDKTGTAPLTLPQNGPGTHGHLLLIAADPYGANHSALISRALNGPIELIPHVPSVLRVSDRMQIGAWLRNNTSKAQTITVTISSTDNLLVQPQDLTATLEPGATTTLRWSVQAQSPGPGHLDFNIDTDQGIAQSQRTQLNVQTSALTQLHTQRSRITQNTSQTIAVPPHMMPSAGGVSVYMGLDGLTLDTLTAADAVQRASTPDTTRAAHKLNALLTLTDLFALTTSDTLKAQQRALTNTLNAAALDDGGFEPWEMAQYPSLRATVAALEVAGRAPWPSLEPQKLQKTLDMAEKALRERTDLVGQPIGALQWLELATVLARIDPGRVRLEADLAPWVRRLNTLTLQEQARLALALAERLRAATDNKDLERILKALAATPLEALTQPRTTALIVLALQTQHEQYAAPLRALTQHLRQQQQAHGHWGSLETNLLALRALKQDALAQTFGAGQRQTSGGVWYNGQFKGKLRLENGVARLGAVNIPSQDMTPGQEQELIVSTATGRPLQYLLTLRTMPQAQGARPHTNLHISRQHLDTHAKPLKDATAKAGQTVLTQLTVAAPDALNNALLEVPIPAGAIALGCGPAQRAGTQSRPPSISAKHIVKDGPRFIAVIDTPGPGAYTLNCAWRANGEGRFALPQASVQVGDGQEAFAWTPWETLTIQAPSN